jgi:AraC-like DNA-binding protein
MRAKTLMIVSSLQYGEQLHRWMSSAALDFELVGIEYNGALGLEQFKEFKPGIVILEASIAIIGVDRYVQLMQSYTTDFAVILLSDVSDAGLNNIRYIYTTLKKSALDSKEFTETVQSAITSLHKQDSPKPFQRKPVYYDALSTLVGDGDFSAKHLYTLRDEYAWKLSSSVNLLLPRPSKRSYQISCQTLNEIREVLSTYNGGELLVMQDGVICILINEIPSTREQNAESRYEDLFSQIRRTLVKDSQASFTFFFSNAIKLNELKRKYADFRQVYDLGYFVKDINLVIPGSLSGHLTANQSGMIENAIIQLAKSLFTSSYDNFCDQFNKLYLGAFKHGMDRKAVVSFGHKLELLSRSMQMTLPDSDEVDTSIFAVTYQTIEEEMEALYTHFNLVFDHLDGRGTSLNELTLQTIALVIENFQEDISQKWIADRIHVTPSYLSHIFKKDIGITFTDYLNNIRITKAKRLIGSQPIKMYEVAEATGFADYRYFSKVFRDLVGVTPTEYQDQVSINIPQH